MTSIARPAALPPGAPDPDDRLRVGQRGAAWITALPDRLVLILFWTCLVVSVALLLRVFQPAAVLPAVLALVLVTWRIAPRELPRSPTAVAGSVLALAMIATWCLANLGYAAEYLIVTRDPGFLTLGGLWLTEHAAPAIPSTTTVQVVQEVYSSRNSGSAYLHLDNELLWQGAKLLPGLLGMLGWAGGARAVLAGNIVIGGLALVAVYGLGRRVAGPLWALVPVVALGASLPMLNFSRAAYTEPLSLALAFGGLTALWSGLETRRPAVQVLGATMIASTALARIDGTAAVIGVVAGLGVAAGATLVPRLRRQYRRTLLLSTMSAGAMIALGWLDLKLSSPKYLHDLMSQFSQLVVALGAVSLVALLLTLPKVLDRARGLALRRRRPLGWLAAGLVLILGALLASRPLWMVSRHLAEGSTFANLVGALQEADGLERDPTRSYDELSLTWLSWYFGWPMVVLAFAGLALLTYRTVRFRDPRALLVLTVVGAPSALFLWRLSITPDQVWAMRRLLPLAIPGFLIVTAMALSALWAVRHVWARVMAGVLAVALVAFPFTTWKGIVTAVEHSGRVAEVAAVCAGIPEGKVVYVGTFPYLPTLATVCEAEVIQFVDPVTAQRLAEVVEEWDEVSVPVVTFAPEMLPWADESIPPPLHEIETTYWPHLLNRLPEHPVVTGSMVWIGVIGPDGIVAPIRD